MGVVAWRCCGCDLEQQQHAGGAVQCDCSLSVAARMCGHQGNLCNCILKHARQPLQTTPLQALQQQRERGSDPAALQSFRYTGLAGELQVGGVFVRVFNARARLGPSAASGGGAAAAVPSDPAGFCKVGASLNGLHWWLPRTLLPARLIYCTAAVRWVRPNTPGNVVTACLLPSRCACALTTDFQWCCSQHGEAGGGVVRLSDTRAHTASN